MCGLGANAWEVPWYPLGPEARPPASQAGSPPLVGGDNSVSSLPRSWSWSWSRSRSAAVWLPEEFQTGHLELSWKAPPSPLRFWLAGGGGCQDGVCHVAGL